MAVGNVPSWAKRYFRDEELPIIVEAIRRAELRTDAEILPVVVKSSTSTDSVPFILGLIVAAFYIFAIVPSRWHLELSLMQWNLVLLGAFVLCYLLSYSKAVQRILLPESQKRLQVEQRALLEFYISDARRTEAGTGILIFVSLMEHKAVVLGDKAISQQIRPETWDETLTILLNGLKKKKGAKAFGLAIESMSEVLHELRPAKAKNPNEIRDALIFKEN